MKRSSVVRVSRVLQRLSVFMSGLSNAGDELASVMTDARGRGRPLPTN